MKRLLLSLVWALLAIEPLGAQQVKLRATLQVALSEPYLGVPLAQFKKDVEALTNKAILIEIVDKGRLYIDTEVVGAVASGVVDMGVAGTYQLAKMLPEIAIVEQPFVFNFGALVRAATSYGSEMRRLIDDAVLETTGMRVLWWQPVGGGVFFSKGTDVGEPRRIQGRKVRVFSQVTARLTQSCGGKPAIMSTSKMHAALRDGVVDLAMGSVTSIEPRRLWQVADTITRTDHMPIEFLLLVNERAWQTLDPTYRAIITETARDVERVARERFAENEAAAYAFARAKGMRVMTPSADQVAEWRACSAGLVEDYMKRSGELGRRLLTAYGKLRTQRCCSSGPGKTPFRRH